jgi:hypothetical protein
MAQTPRPGQARFTTRYTQTEKDAILRAVLVEGHTVVKARQLAAQGELGVPAFEIGNYAYDVVRDGREGFESRDDAALDRAMAEDIRLDAIAALAHNRALRARLKGDGTDDPEALKRAATALHAIRKLRNEGKQAPRPKPGTVQTSDTGANTAPTGDTLTNLLGPVKREAGEGERTGSFPRSLNGPAAA